MIARSARTRVQQLLTRHPAVGLLGPRQAGKTTLALELGRELPSLYLDLEAPSDRAKLQETELYLATHDDKLVILDEIQRMPGLFQTLRAVIDAGRRSGRRTGRFLVLGSASLDLLQQTAESLAGRIVYAELGPLSALEVLDHGERPLERLWSRGGFPESFLADDEPSSLEWREAFIRTYLERDVPQLGPRIPAETLRRFFTMLAHSQGGRLNAAALAAGLGVSGQTVARYLDLLVDLLLARRLPPWHSNSGKRLVRSPKVYLRDSGLLHSLLNLRDLEALLGHPIAGPSWEGFVIESLLAEAPSGCEASYYRSSAGAEIDLVLSLAPGRLWAIEIKRSLRPAVARGFHHACAELRPEHRFVVYPGSERFPLGPDLLAISLSDLAQALRAGTL